jgi:hypothetical protein
MTSCVFEKSTYRHKNIGIRVTSRELSNLHKFCEIENLTISELIRKSVNEFVLKQKEVSIF